MKNAQAKITVYVWKPLLQKLEEKLEALSMKRDAFLSKVLPAEINQLQNDIAIPNSLIVQQYLLNAFEPLNCKGLCLCLPAELVEKINRVCKNRGVPRVLFFNRLFLLLGVNQECFNSLFFSRSQGWEERMLDYLWGTNKADFINRLHPLTPEISPLANAHFAKTVLSKFEKTEIVRDQDKDIFVRRHKCGDLIPIGSLYGDILENEFVGINCCFPVSLAVAATSPSFSSTVLGSQC